MIWVDLKEDEFSLEKKYTFDLIFFTLGIEYKFLENENEINDKDLIIYYSNKYQKKFNNKYIWIKESGNFFNEYYLKCKPQYNVKKLALEKNIKSIKDIVSIFSKENKLIDNEDNGILLYVDIISDIFFMVTRYEEVICEESDSHKRFLLDKSLAYKFKFLDRPIVNEQIEMFLELLRSIDNNIEKRNKWGKNEFVFFLSHDIDTIFKYKDKIIKNVGIKLLKDKDIKSSLELCKNYFKVIKDKNNDPFWKFDYLLELEKKYNISASYYFMAGGETGLDNYYSIDNKVLGDVFSKIKRNLSEVGIHGSYNSYNNQKLLEIEKQRINKYSDIVGIRQHYLRFTVPSTWSIQEKCNFKYDATLGYANHIGFRAGICTPYKPFDVLNRRCINIMEIPLIVMDGTVLEKQYMGLDVIEAVKYIKQIINRIIEVNGVFSLLWHNSSLDESSVGKEWIEVYEEIIKYCVDKNSLSISGEKIIKLYT